MSPGLDSDKYNSPYKMLVIYTGVTVFVHTVLVQKASALNVIATVGTY